MNVDLPTPGTPEIPNPTAGAWSGTGLERSEQVAGLDPVLGPAGLDERDRLGHGRAAAREHSLDERGDGGRHALRLVGRIPCSWPGSHCLRRASRYWPFQGIETGLLFAAAFVPIGFCRWRIPRGIP